MVVHTDFSPFIIHFIQNVRIQTAVFLVLISFAFVNASSVKWIDL